ncbi:MAG: hypothetical protein GFH27_549325n11 [Chloroflexi bacterium AL-W]|nr:hypothetical protein [Chloroflexi bacterium AL-N1]NOK70139.1 hypothetical protein [Chloroflexi bacterium AL-N10]NOK77849.1 hypothetical protein [Chloroflexi bacterium AL-N5]NOK84858.1 hypothetical protein [Chloroflexi bacterium AL-W]NOK91837.1 hypothetical protein [Chloroflexi bacterium AL-N15]
MDQHAFLRLLQLFDSQFPIGSFAHSSGLETYAQMDLSKEQLAELLRVQLLYGFGRLDLAACARAYEAESDDELVVLCAEVTAWKPIRGIRETSLKLGKRMLTLAKRIYPQTSDLHIPEPHQAIVCGLLGQRLAIGKEAVLLAFAQSSVVAQLQAATRCMPLSPEQAQEILIDVQPLIVGVVTRMLEDSEGGLVAATPALDVRAHQQAFLYTRLFQS